MFFSGDTAESRRGARPAMPTGAALALVAAVAGVLVLGIIPGPFAHLAHDAVARLVAAGR